MRYRLQRHDGTDCSATMVPITVLRMVPIQRYRQNSCKVHLIVLILLQGFHDVPYGRRKYTQREKNVFFHKLIGFGCVVQAPCALHTRDKAPCCRS